ncbi:MAG TPA: MoaD/ThiS family protein [Chthoniobacterales bacterium]|nr:MoaD/ThiS family protein [Chthoniobacterales bacterium]
MNVHVQFFSRLRDLAEVSEMDLELPEATKVAELLEVLYARTPALRDWDKSILVAAGVEFVDRDYVLQADDQISIMPPVQGG